MSSSTAMTSPRSPISAKKSWAEFAAWPVWTGLAMSWFHVDATQLGTVVLAFFTEIRFYFLFVLLAPALALHWTLRSERARP